MDILANKLKEGDNIRVISPSKSMAQISKDLREIANFNLKNIGLNVSYSKNVEEVTDFRSSSIKSRIEDLHSAFEDNSIQGILTTLGGYNSNQLLKYIDFNLIKKHPKIICGYSDITIISNSIYAKTGLITYYGPHYSTFGMKKGNEYTIDYFKKCIMQDKPFKVKAPEKWNEDEWFRDQENRDIKTNTGNIILHPGTAKGKILGGNLGTFCLLHGTEYMPNIKNSVLFLEDCYGGEDVDLSYDFDRNLVSLIQQKNFDKVKGIVFGRFQTKSQITIDKLKKIIETKEELKDIPIIANADFGHTNPMFTFPIGGTFKFSAEDKVKLEIKKH